MASSSLDSSRVPEKGPFKFEDKYSYPYMSSRIKYSYPYIIMALVSNLSDSDLMPSDGDSLIKVAFLLVCLTVSLNGRDRFLSLVVSHMSLVLSTHVRSPLIILMFVIV